MIRSDLALAALATAAVPGMRPVSVAAIRTGEETPQHQSALIEDVTGRTWLIRSPLGAAAGAELERNDDLIRQLGRHLPFKVPAAAGYADLGPDGRAVVYPYVEGLALSLRHLPVGPGLASAVGRAIAAVHNMPRELFEEFAVPVFDADEVRARKLAELDRAAETGHVPNGLLARWEQALDAVSMWKFATAPTHGTLDGSSFLVAFSDDSDAASGRVVGLSGWERAQIGDPAEDFARLVELANPRAVDSTFESYSLARSQRPDGYLLHRARLASEMRLLTGLAAAVGSGDEAFVRRRADELRKLDRLTTSDNSLVPRTALEPVTAVTDLSRQEEGPGTGEPFGDPAADPSAPTVTADVDTTAPVPLLPSAQPDAVSTDLDARTASDSEGPAEAETGSEAPAEAETDPEAPVDAQAEAETDPEAPIDAQAEAEIGSEAPIDPRAEAAVDEQTENPLESEDHPAIEVDDTDNDDEPAVIVESPADGAHLEPVSAADVTAPIPMFHPVGATGADPSPAAVDLSAPSADDTAPEEASDPSADSSAPEEGQGGPPDPQEAELLKQEADAQEREQRAADERLHALYGMPDDPDLGAADPDGR